MSTKFLQFKEGENDIYWLGSNFKKRFGQIQFEITTDTLKTKTLERSVFDKEILAELQPQEATLGDLYHALTYLDKGGWYIFYIRDEKNTLWAVGARWYSGGGWGVEAGSVERPGRWSDGRRVVSRGFFDTK